MATITPDMRIEAYRKASEYVQEMCVSPETTRLLGHLRKEYKIQDDTFIDLVGDIMLGFYRKSDFQRLLRELIGVSDEVAQSIENELSSLFLKIDKVPTASQDIREELKLRPEGVLPNTPPMREVVPQPAVKPLTREEVLRAVTSRRTMASDIEMVRQQKASDQETSHS